MQIKITLFSHSHGVAAPEGLAMDLVAMYPALGDRTQVANLPEIWYEKALEGSKHATGFLYDRLQTVRRRRKPVEANKIDSRVTDKL